MISLALGFCLAIGAQTQDVYWFLLKTPALADQVYGSG